MLRNSKHLGLIGLLWIGTAHAQSVPSGPASGGSGTVTSVSVTTANGVSGAVATATTTPAISLTLGAITPSSVAIGGATLGANALAVTGLVQITDSSATNSLTIDGSSNSNGPGIKLLDSIGGKFIRSNGNSLQVINSAYNAVLFGLDDSGNASIAGGLKLPGVSSDAATTDATLCRKSSDGTVLFGSGTLGICLGTSSARFKTDIQELDVGLTQINALKAKSFYLDAAHGDPTKLYYGFIAEDAVSVLPKLVGLDDEHLPTTFDYLGVVPVLVKAVQELSAKVAVLQGGK